MIIIVINTTIIILVNHYNKNKQAAQVRIQKLKICILLGAFTVLSPMNKPPHIQNSCSVKPY